MQSVGRRLIRYEIGTVALGKKPGPGTAQRVSGGLKDER